MRKSRLFSPLLAILFLLPFFQAMVVAGQWTGALDPACLAVRTAPQLFSSDVVSPQTLLAGGTAPSGYYPNLARLARGTVQYVSANYLRVNLVTDRCTDITAVRFGSRSLTTTNQEGFSYSDVVTDPLPGYPGRVQHSLWIYFPYGRDGSTSLVRVTLGRAFRSAGTVEHSFPVVRVSRVEAADIPAPIGFSQAELFNSFGKALYERFNRATNSAYVTASDGKLLRIYGYNPSSLGLKIDSAGISFSFRFRIDTKCQPRALVKGQFKLNADRGAGGITLQWTHFPYAILQYADECELAIGVPIVGDLLDWIFFKGGEGRVAGGVAISIEEALRASLPDLGSAAATLDGSSTRSGELIVNLRLPAPSVLIQVPYDAFDMDRTGTAFAPDETFTMLARALAPPDIIAASNPPVTASSGPNGVPQTGTTTWPNAITFTRWEPLAWSGVPIARLMARRTDPPGLRTYQYRPGCSIAVGSRWPLPVSIRLGVNDTATDAQRLRPTPAAHGYWVRLFFGDGLMTSPCLVNPPDLDSTVP